MNLEKYNWIKKNVYFRCRKFGFQGEIVEEIAHEVIESMLTKPDRRATIDQLVVDILRKKYNLKGFGSRFGSKSYPKEFSLEQEEYEIPDARDFGRHMEDRIFIDGIISTLREKDQELAKLYFIEGMNEAEISDHYKISYFRIRTRVQRIQKCLRKRAKKKSESEIETERFLEKVLFKQRIRMEFPANQRLAFEKPWEMEGYFRPSFSQWIT